MRLIFIYGPPAVGKLTVARELARLTGFPIFHNHVTVNPFRDLFGWGSPVFGEVTTRTRLLVFAAAAKHRIAGLIFTFVYGAGLDDPFVRRVVRTVELHGGKVCFVKLEAPMSVLLTRIPSSSNLLGGMIPTYGQFMLAEPLHRSCDHLASGSSLG